MDLSDNINAYSKNAQLISKIGAKLGLNLPTQLPKSVENLEECYETYLSGRAILTNLLVNSSGGFSIESLTKLAQSFDSDWDKFAKHFNALYDALTPGEQANILETFAKTHFGPSVFAAGSVIKNETTNILGGISSFKSGIDAFSGSYRNPVEAINKIKTGVNNIVASTQQVAGSLNNIYRTIAGKGNPTGVEGLPGLNQLEKLGSFKPVAAATSILNIGGDAIGVFSSAQGLQSAVKSGDLKQVIAQGKSLVNGAKQLANDI